MAVENSVRIIAGQCRGRKIHFPPITELRPTPDRVRETLFNWLRDDIVESRCLDLFAGSGALGFEALSRGAKHVVFVDRHLQVITAIQRNAKLLNFTSFTTIRQEALSALRQAPGPFDIVFLDPPFQGTDWPALLSALSVPGLLTDSAYVYLEMPEQAVVTLPKDWQLLKEQRAGLVYTILCRVDKSML